MSKPSGWFRQRWAQICEMYDAQHPPVRPKRAPKNWPSSTPPLIWPCGGVFMVKEFAKAGKFPAKVNRYDPRAHRNEIFQAVLKLNPDKPKDLLRFVNTWGVLGVENPVMAWNRTILPFDGVSYMAEWVRLRHFWMASYQSLQSGRPQLASDLAHAFGPSFGPGVMTTLTTPNATVTQSFLVQALEHLIGRPVRLGVVTGDELRPVYRLQTLKELFDIELWHTISSKQEFRPCLGCQDYFIPTRQDQEYHSVDCGNKARQQRVRDKRREKKSKTRLQS